MKTPEFIEFQYVFIMPFVGMAFRPFQPKPLDLKRLVIRPCHGGQEADGSARQLRSEAPSLHHSFDKVPQNTCFFGISMQELSVLKRCVPKTLAFAFGLRLRSVCVCVLNRGVSRRVF